MTPIQRVVYETLFPDFFPVFEYIQNEEEEEGEIDKSGEYQPAPHFALFSEIIWNLFILEIILRRKKTTPTIKHGISISLTHRRRSGNDSPH